MSSERSVPRLLGARGILALAGHVRLVLVAAAWSVLPGPLSAAFPPSPPQLSEVDSLRRANRALKMEIDLASAGRPYLVLDLSGRAMILKSHGVVLREFPFHGLRAKRRSLDALFGAAPPLDTVWVEGRLMPGRRIERLVILSDTLGSQDHSGTVEFIPPTPEEETPSPASFRIRYNDGLSLVVQPWVGEAEDPDGIPARAPSLFARLLAWARSRPWLRDRVRIDLTLPEGEAGSLYRAFSDGTPLLVMGSWPGRRDPG